MFLSSVEKLPDGVSDWVEVDSGWGGGGAGGSSGRGGYLGGMIQMLR